VRAREVVSRADSPTAGEELDTLKKGVTLKIIRTVCEAISHYRWYESTQITTLGTGVCS
jgi:hypothetical protein